ncbi:MAG: DUF4292 domain-containing protein [Balneolaceae bacterium]|nr:DUF4292 domain-containing protein [Balneolaceae bacterium]
MIPSSHSARTLVGVLALLLAAACSSTRELADTEFGPTDVTPAQLARALPDYRGSLHAVSGEGRAVVSSEEGTERVTIRFRGNRLRSLLEIRNSLGIEGGRMLSDGDTLLIWNRLDGFARKIPIRPGSLRSIDHLASLNVLQMLNFTVEAAPIRRVLASDELLRADLEGGGKIYAGRSDTLVRRVEQPPSSGLPYSRIDYEAYARTGDYAIPRKITIFSADGNARVVFQIRSLEINPELDSLRIDLPPDIPIYHGS